MLKIRLQRVGRKNDTSFRVVVTDSKKSVTSGNSVEVLGSYDPRVDTADLKIDRIKHWISVGAGISDTAHNLFVSKKIIEGKKVNVLPKKSPIKKVEEEKKEEIKAEVKEDAENKDKATLETKEETPKKDEKSETENPVEKLKESEEEPKEYKEKKEGKVIEPEYVDVKEEKAIEDTEDTKKEKVEVKV